MRQMKDEAKTPALIAVAVVAVVALSALVAAKRELTSLESVFLQAAALVIGVWASFSAGKQAGRDEEAARTKASARSAFRRVTRIYEFLGSLITSIEERRVVLHHASGNRRDVSISSVDASLDVLRVQVTGQIGTANDAMDDWRDLVPEEVAELEQRAQEGPR